MSDDGRGLDVARIKRKAIERGLRDIDGARNFSFESKDPALMSEFHSIISELEQIIEREKNAV